LCVCMTICACMCGFQAAQRHGLVLGKTLRRVEAALEAERGAREEADDRARVRGLLVVSVCWLLVMMVRAGVGGHRPCGVWWGVACVCQ
jgi:hypothetical protein